MKVRFSTVGLTFVLFVVVEVLAFIGVTQLTGFWWALLLLIAASVAGGWLVKHEGVRAWQRFRSVSEAGERPGPHLTRAFTGLAGALLLLIPGFVTAVIGLLLFLPPVRALAGIGAVKFATARLPSSAAGDLFGPRRVRVKTGKPVRTPGGTGPVTAETSGTRVHDAGTDPGEAIEGEIIDPR